MKHLFLLPALLFLSHTILFAQGCLPEGITFTSQEQINNFQNNYPGCTEIEGDVEITGSSLYNLSGLDVLTTIGGNLYIHGCYNISSFNGLHNLLNVDEDFIIEYMNNLDNFEGLSNLSNVGGDFLIEDNNSILNFEGLDNLSSINGDFVIIDNYDMVSFEGLSALSSISGDLKIKENDHLLSLTGLENLNPGSLMNVEITLNNSLSNCHVEGLCQYLTNPNGKIKILTNAEGCDSPVQIANYCGITLPCLPFGDYNFFNQADIDNFQINYPGCTTLEGDVEINGNDITNLNGLNLITAISGEFLLEDNSNLMDLTGLENLTSIGSHLNIGSWYQNYQGLTSLNGLTNLDSIGGNLYIIENTELTNLTALSNLTAIEGSLIIDDNDALVGLTGLEGIHNVDDLIVSGNVSLESLAEFDNIEFVNTFLNIIDNEILSGIEGLGNIHTAEYVSISNNPALQSLSGLDSLSEVWGIGVVNNDILTNLSGLNNLTIVHELSIRENDQLVDITELENVDPVVLLFLMITENNVLSDCDIECVCENLYGITQIHDNAPGCNSPEEVEEHCLTSVAENSAKESVTLFPNPATSFITIQIQEGIPAEQAIIYNHLGQKVLETKPVNNTLDVSMLKAGMYMIEAITNGTRYRTKMIKNK